MVLKGTRHALCYSLLLMIMGSVYGSHSLAPECFRRSVSWFWVLLTSVLSFLCFCVFCIIISLPRPFVCVFVCVCLCEPLCLVSLFCSHVPLLVCRSTLPPPIYFSQAVMSLLSLSVSSPLTGSASPSLSPPVIYTSSYLFSFMRIPSLVSFCISGVQQ